MKINIMKLKLTALLLVLYTGLYAQNKIVLTAPRLDTSSLSNRINLKANTNLNNVNGVLSSTYGGAGTVSGILKANGSGVVSAAVAGDITSLISGTYVDLTTNQTIGGLKSFNSPITITANSSANNIVMYGRASDNFSQQLFYNNTGSTRYAYIQSHSTNSGQLSLVGDGGGRIDLDNRGVVIATGALSGTSLSMSGDGRFGTSTALTGIAGGIVTNSATSSGMTMRVSDVNKGYIYVSGSDVVMEGAASMNVKLLTSSGYYYNLAPSGLATSNAIRTLFNTTTDNGTDALQVAGSGLFTGTLKTGTGSGNTLSSGSVDVGKDIGLAATQGIVVNNARVLSFASTGAAAFSSTANSDWGLTVLNSGTTGANGLYVNIGSGATGIPFRVDKNGSSLFTVANTGAITASSSVTAASLIKSGGTSAQFLKADGSVDGSTYLTSAGAVTSIAGTTNQITVSASTGSVTVSLPSAVTISGAMNASSFFETSDLRKKDIVSVTEQADGIDFVGFKWKKELNLDSKKHLGVIAQQVEKVLPDAVNTDEKGDKSVNYTEVLIFKLQSLTEKVSELEKELKKLKTKKLKN